MFYFLLSAGNSQSTDNKPSNTTADPSSGSTANASESDKQAKNPIDKDNDGAALLKLQTKETNEANSTEFCVLIEFHMHFNLTFATVGKSIT